ncbi:hypothetical protein B4U80_03995 [Leptotrombidium deliense]|uniref:Uncharacterized protein n=1 Tax=Leptotrombidium deliense TaxID=299467 RepID=A0A443S638_9ACAR|nr:hypothetical protein B4U80_03995 [Leptotrombidium deliense]
MYFHAKSIELWTNSFQNVLQVNEELDLIEFRNKFGIKVNDATKANDTLLATLRRFSSSPSVFSPEKKPKDESDKSDVYDTATSTECDSQSNTKIDKENTTQVSNIPKSNSPPE